MREIPLILTALLVLTGCDDDVSVEPVAASGSTLCVADYEACVNPVFDAVLTGKTGQTTCAGSGCHNVNSGSGGAFKVFPNAEPGSTEMLANFFAAKGFANLDEPANSKLILEPLQGESSVSSARSNDWAGGVSGNRRPRITSRRSDCSRNVSSLNMVSNSHVANQ